MGTNRLIQTGQVELRKIEAGDLKRLIFRKARSYVGRLTPEQETALEAQPFAYSILVDGQIVMCGGAIQYWKNRGEAWAVLDPAYSLKACGRGVFTAVHKLVVGFLDQCPLNRIEAAVAVDFTPGHKWVKHLGFEIETERCKAFLPDGKDASLYVRIRAGG